MVARVISVRSALGAARQVFLVSMGGYDTHADQDATHPGLLTQLADAISLFQTTIHQMGIANDVTLFTASDFGRTLASRTAKEPITAGARITSSSAVPYRARRSTARFPT